MAVIISWQLRGVPASASTKAAAPNAPSFLTFDWLGLARRRAGAALGLSAAAGVAGAAGPSACLPFLAAFFLPAVAAAAGWSARAGASVSRGSTLVAPKRLR